MSLPDHKPTANDSTATVIFFLIFAFCLSPWASPPLALTVGIAFALFFSHPFPRSGQKVSKILLQTSVVFLGFGMDLPVVLRAGARGALFAMATIATTLVLGYFVGKWLGVSAKVSALIASGTAICGGSAIAAVGSAIDADESDMTVAIGTVFLLNAAALFLFPVLGHALGLTQLQFGTWAGVAIHDVSSVVGAASRYGLDALQIATAVKLSRALWIVPLVLGMGWWFDGSRSTSRRPRIQVPYFIGLFVLASLLRSFVPAVAEVSPTLTQIARIGLTLTLFLIGAGMSRKTLATVGWRAFAQGAILWLFISLASLAVVMTLI